MRLAVADELRLGAAEDAFLGLETVDGLGEDVHQSSDHRVRGAQNAIVAAEIDTQLGDVGDHRAALGRRACFQLRLGEVVEHRPEVLEPEPDSGDGLSGVAGQHHLVLGDNQHQQSQLRLREVLHLINQQRVDRRSRPAVGLDLGVDGVDELRAVPCVELALQLLVLLEGAVHRQAAEPIARR